MDIENIVQIVILFSGILIYLVSNIPYISASLINITFGICYYLLIRPVQCPYNGCKTYASQSISIDTVERFFQTIFVFWKEKYSYIYNPKLDPLLMTPQYKRLAYRSQNLFLADEWYYNTWRALITECLAIGLNYYLAFVVMFYIIDKLFLNPTPFQNYSNYSKIEKSEQNINAKDHEINIISSDLQVIFDKAAIFYPDIKSYYNRLYQIDKSLADKYKEELIENKTFSESEIIYDKYLLQYITNYLDGSDAILLARTLLENNEIEKLKKLIEISKLLGKSFDLDLVLKKM